MKTNNRLKRIEKNSFKMGNQEYKTFTSTGSLKALDGTARAYRTSMQAMRWQILYNAIKSE